MRDTLFVRCAARWVEKNGKTADVRADLHFVTLLWLPLGPLGNIRCLADNESGITN